MKRVFGILIVLCLLIAFLEALPSGSKKYRLDYEYNPETDAFYKLHIEYGDWQYAFDQCAMEGASLMSPGNGADVSQASAMLRRYPDIDQAWTSDEPLYCDSEKGNSYNDLNFRHCFTQFRPRCKLAAMFYREDLLREMRECVFGDHPFICKVDAKEAPYDDICHVYGTRYDYYESVGSCYKVPNIALTWDQAYAECKAEGAHLVVLNSKEEARAVWDIIRTASKVEDTTSALYYLAGIRADKSTNGSARQFKTFDYIPLEKTGYHEWQDGEPNNFQDVEYCGAISSEDGKYNDVSCFRKFQCVCEKEVQ